MSDVFDPEDFEGIQERKVSIPRRQIRELEARAKRAEELEAKLATVERNQIFVEAGIPNEGPGSWFRKGYDGELTVEAVRQAYGMSGAPAQAQATADSLAGHQAARAMSAGANNAAPSGGLAELAALKQKSRSRKNGHMGYEQEQAELNAILSREGVSSAADLDFRSDWKYPGHLVGGS
jgi:hypothetical protein